MFYKDLCGEKTSALGFGAMRLPLKEDKSIDVLELQKMIDFAMENGINYYDTAYPYHGGKSEIELCKALKKYPRESYFLADKYPGHQIASTYNPQEIFEDQLKKCQVDYFDFYLLHNVYENSINTYKDPKWNIVEYFVNQKKAGKIKHLGFSCHGDLPILKEFLDLYAPEMEFCQIQLNYVDWTMQKAKEKYELLLEKNIPIVVMEPLHGGKLCSWPNISQEEKMKKLRPQANATAWGFDFLMSLDNVKVTLSGMSNFSQMKENVEIYNKMEVLNQEETSALLNLAEELKNSVPCTACKYCTPSCPMKLDIPKLISYYNDLKYNPTFTVSMKLEVLPERKQPIACLECGNCQRNCPQKIQIADIMRDFKEILSKLPKWEVLCKEREEAARKERGE